MGKSKSLETCGFAIAAMFGIYWIYSVFIQEHLNIDSMLKTVIGLFILYGAGLFLFVRLTKKIPDSPIKKGKVDGRTVLICFLLQFSALTIMGFITNVLSGISGQSLQPDLNVLSPFMLFLLLLFNPLLEELVFRKMFAEKLLKHGELFYMTVSSFCFAIVHAVALGIPQAVYTFMLAMIWSYLFVKTGSIKLPVILHSLSNLFGGIAVQFLQRFSETALGAYSVLMIMLSVSGIVLFAHHGKTIELDGQNRLVDKSILKEMFSSRGMIFYAVLTAVMFVLKAVM